MQRWRTAPCEPLLAQPCTAIRKLNHAMLDQNAKAPPPSTAFAVTGAVDKNHHPEENEGAESEPERQTARPGPQPEQPDPDTHGPNPPYTAPTLPTLPFQLLQYTSAPSEKFTKNCNLVPNSK